MKLVCLLVLMFDLFELKLKFQLFCPFLFEPHNVGGAGLCWSVVWLLECCFHQGQDTCYRFMHVLYHVARLRSFCRLFGAVIQ